MRLTVRRIYRDTWAHKRPPPLPDDNRRTFRETLALPITKKPAQAGFGVCPLNHQKHRRPLAVKARAAPRRRGLSWP